MASRAPEWRESIKRGAIRSGTMLGSIALVLSAVLLALILISYNPSDPAMNTAAGGPVQNILGAAGAWTADILLWTMGPAIALLIPQMLIHARRLWVRDPITGWKKRTAMTIAAIALADMGVALIWPGAIDALPGGSGGAIGMATGSLITWLVGFAPSADWLFWVRWTIISLVIPLSIYVWFRGLSLSAAEKSWLLRRKDAVQAPVRPRNVPDLPFDVEGDASDNADTLGRTPEPRTPPVIDESRKKTIIADKPTPAAPKADKSKEQASLPLGDGYVLPSLDLLAPAPPSAGDKLDKTALERNARLLETVLDDFHDIF